MDCYYVIPNQGQKPLTAISSFAVKILDEGSVNKMKFGERIKHLSDFLKKSLGQYQDKTSSFELSKELECQKSVGNTLQSTDILQEYALTIFLHSVGSRPSPVKNNDGYPLYITTECGISKPKDYHKKLIQNGYLKEATFPAILSLATIPELKALLDKFGLKKTGKKDELIMRIDENVSEEFKQSYVASKKCYDLTESGRSVVDKNKDYLLLHRHKLWDINPVEYVRSKENYPEKNFYDICVTIFDQRIEGYTKSKKYSLVRCTYLYKAQLYEKETNCYLSLYNYLIVLLYDVSGILNTFDGEYIPGMNSVFCICNNDKIMTYQNECTDEMVKEIYEKYKPPFCICPYTFFLEIICGIFEGTLNEEKVIKKLDSLFHRKTK